MSEEIAETPIPVSLERIVDWLQTGAASETDEMDTPVAELVEEIEETLSAGLSTVHLADDAVTNAKLANMTRGTVKVGGVLDAPTDLNAKTSGQILVGDGTDLKSVAVSGDASLAANGALTIANGAISETKMADAARPISATITVGEETGGNTINVAIQLKDGGAGADLAARGCVHAYLSDDANGDSVAATAPSGHVAVGTDGLCIHLVTDKAFLLTSEADGDIDLNIVEAGAATWYLILVRPNGCLVASGAITFAGE